MHVLSKESALKVRAHDVHACYLCIRGSLVKEEWAAGYGDIVDRIGG
jgi:hypothetical protein